ncbi:uncharacterized protein LOC120076721 [Benincasa hispida]|uniref:uncharacterized protein LOC120076721 n=1 Tax=Benincasa hispida TaxID=102211 RepID=UPI0019013A6F|nr:uncharacterized protein LOC120076721 [Benincasa hispida]
MPHDAAHHSWGAGHATVSRPASSAARSESKLPQPHRPAFSHYPNRKPNIRRAAPLQKPSRSRLHSHGTQPLTSTPPSSNAPQSRRPAPTAVIAVVKYVLEAIFESFWDVAHRGRDQFLTKIVRFDKGRDASKIDKRNP